MLGNDRMYRYLKAYGLGTRTGIEVPGEEAGLLHPPRKWSKISIMSHRNSTLWAALYTAVTFPALIRLLVVSLHSIRVKNHKVIRTNVHANSSVTALATVTLFRVYITWHSQPPFWVLFLFSSIL
jgi:hypothetical protein